MIDLYWRQGGSCLGLAILKGVADRFNLIVPDDLILSLEDAARIGADQLVESLPPTLRPGFALKYSGHQESFSPGCTRGRHSSRRRFWDGGDQDQARTLVAEAIINAPPGTQAVVFQQYVKTAELSGVFYAYGYEGRVLVEAISRGRRTFTEIRNGHIVDYATVTGEHIRSGSVLEADPLQLYRAISGLRDAVGFDLDMEGFASPNGVIAVQLRPIPEDMPRVLHPAHLPHPRGDWHRTPWIWGSWQGGPSTVDEDVPGRPAVMVKRTTSLADCPDIVRRLHRGDRTLVVDLCDGFRLSHDPRHLPEVIPHRSAFAYISVAGSSLAQLQAGETVEAFVDGDTGLIRRTTPVGLN
ncbi:hypothetical protein [Streptomyces sp. DSM 40484]|uniref:hypothetical protein n=1 Tax=Streptomyces kroppenstedtii TaxID=3051181 RepID=UPI0028D71A1A|nr:hypothetical protein [Streptomyces sp. DSM 40484]